VGAAGDLEGRHQELFGGPTSLPWGLRIDPAHRPDGYAAFSTFQPTFLYELLFDLSLAAMLVILVRRGRIRSPGVFAVYVAGYSGFRIFEETLRIDPAHHVLGLRLNFFVATVLCLSGLAWFAWTQRDRITTRTARRGGALLAAGWAACTMGACGDHHDGVAAAERSVAVAVPVVFGQRDDGDARDQRGGQGGGQRDGNDQGDAAQIANRQAPMNVPIGSPLPQRPRQDSNLRPAD
jgi:hypothetical protein